MNELQVSDTFPIILHTYIHTRVHNMYEQERVHVDVNIQLTV